MPGFDDPRFLQQKIEALERDLANLRTHTLPLALQQRGPEAGYMRAVQINDPGLASAMWMNLNGNTPGVAPYQAVTDPNAVVRVELGNLAAVGNSPAQIGIRVSDANRVPIFDSLGLIGVMSLIASSQDFSITIPSGAGFSAVGTLLTFTVPRALRYLVISFCSVQDPASTTSTLEIAYDGVADTTLQGSWGNTAGTGVQTAPGTLVAVKSFSAGSHTVQVFANSGGTGVGTIGTLNNYVFQLGS